MGVCFGNKSVNEATHASKKNDSIKLEETPAKQKPKSKPKPKPLQQKETTKSHKANTKKLKKAKVLSNDDPDVYSFVFKSRPFGVTFGKTEDRKNLFVVRIKPESAASNSKVSVGSLVIKFQDETVENVGAAQIYKMLSAKYSDVVPFTITFRKSDQQNTLNKQKHSENNIKIAKTVKTASKPQRERFQPDVYSFVFISKPFGLLFGKTKDKKNLFVSGIDADSKAAKSNITVGSIVMKFQDEIVENLGAKHAYKVFTGRYTYELPLKITFRKSDQHKTLGQDIEGFDDYKEEGNEQMYGDDVYSFTFESKPFGLTFGKTKDKKNLFVAAVEAESIADRNVSVGSVVVRFEHEMVENLGAKHAYKAFTRYLDKLPLRIMFRRAAEHVTLGNDFEGDTDDNVAEERKPAVMHDNYDEEHYEYYEDEAEENNEESNKDKPEHEDEQCEEENKENAENAENAENEKEEIEINDNYEKEESVNVDEEEYEYYAANEENENEEENKEENNENIENVVEKVEINENTESAEKVEINDNYKQDQDNENMENNKDKQEYEYYEENDGNNDEDYEYYEFEDEEVAFSV